LWAPAWRQRQGGHKGRPYGRSGRRFARPNLIGFMESIH
jgi:hypothetical protein